MSDLQLINRVAARSKGSAAPESTSPTSPEYAKLLVPVTEKLDAAEKTILVSALLKCLSLAQKRLTGREKAVAEKVVLTEF